MKSNAIYNDGTWPPVKHWLDELTHGGLFRVPTGQWSPVTPRPDGVLDLWDVGTGANVGQCPVGDWVIFGPDGFASHHFATPSTSIQSDHQSKETVKVMCAACGRKLTNDTTKPNAAAWTRSPLRGIPYCADSDACRRDAAGGEG